ncbi:MAG: hypothetical protein IM638_01215 [Bacteroidetes bacterium]|nr:hypothetical protein [Bacteroidota bacterium]
MEPVHIHLIVTHFPIIASFLGAVVLVWGMLYKSKPTQTIALLILVASAVGAAISNFTGEAAEEVAERIAGVSHSVIHEHEEAAELAFVLQLVMGVLALVSLIMAWRKSALTRIATIVTLLVALAAFVFVARAGYYGGMIRHPEATGQLQPAAAGAEHDEPESEH